MLNQYKSALDFSKIVPKLASLRHWNNLEKSASNDLFDLTHIPKYFEIYAPCFLYAKKMVDA
jgi:hypothetical protein